MLVLPGFRDVVVVGGGANVVTVVGGVVAVVGVEVDVQLSHNTGHRVIIGDM